MTDQENHAAAVASVAASTAARAAISEFIRSPEFAETIDATVCKTLERLGIDTRDPEKTRRDMVSLRNWRELTEFIKREGVGAVVKWIVAGLLAAIMIGLGVFIGKHP